jgi:large conductance mechanosensitive channel
MLQEFKAFVTKGDVAMLAVGFIMGLAFQAVITSLVDNVLMPIIAIPFGEPSFDDLTLTLSGSVILYGSFLTTLVTFLLTAVAVFFFIVKPYNAYVERFGKTSEEAQAGPTEIELLAEIRDELKRTPA